MSIPGDNKDASANYAGTNDTASDDFDINNSGLTKDQIIEALTRKVERRDKQLKERDALLRAAE
eukprot:5760760-Pyramimonas_sp.AAC.1